MLTSVDIENMELWVESYRCFVVCFHESRLVTSSSLQAR